MCLTDLDTFESYANTPLKLNQFCGISVIDVQTPPLNLQLVSKTDSTVYLPNNIQIKGSLVVFKESSGEATGSCFAHKNFAHLLQQYVEAYSSTTWAVFSDMIPTTSGTPIGLYTSPDGNSPGLLIMSGAGGTEILTIDKVVGIYPGEGTVYDPNFTFLTPPEPFPAGCDSDKLLALRDYVPFGVELNVRLGPNVSASGPIYKNEIGVMVMSDEDGNTPILLQSDHIIRITIADQNEAEMQGKSKKLPQISVINQDSESSE